MLFKPLNFFKVAFNAPLLVIATGVMLSLLFRLIDMPVLPSEMVAMMGVAGLGFLSFAAGTQFRLSRLAKICPVSFRLCFGGGPLFLLACGLAAFILIPQLSLASAFLLGGVLMLNGSAFDRRVVMNAPTPALVKAGVRLESAVILSLGLPIVILLQGNASAAALGQGMLLPLLATSKAVINGFALGGCVGLVTAIIGNRYYMNFGSGLAVIAAALVMIIAPVIGGHPVIAAAALGLIWGEQSRAGYVTRIKLRMHFEHLIIPATYLIFGFVLAPRIFEADLLVLTFALAAVTVMRAGPRLAALQRSALPKEGQVFFAWFGGTPGAASALYLLTLLDSANLHNQELLLTLGSVCVFVGVLTARLTSQPLAQNYIRNMATAHRRNMFG